jgi:hypothetical protein
MNKNAGVNNTLVGLVQERGQPLSSNLQMGNGPPVRRKRGQQ